MIRVERWNHPSQVSWATISLASSESMEVGRNVYTLTGLCNFCPYGNWHWSLWKRRFHWCNYVQVRPRSRHLLRGNGELEPSSQWASLFYVTLAPNNATLFIFSGCAIRSGVICGVCVCMYVYRKDGKKRENRRTMKGDERLWNSERLLLAIFPSFFTLVSSQDLKIFDRSKFQNTCVQMEINFCKILSQLVLSIIFINLEKRGI